MAERLICETFGGAPCSCPFAVSEWVRAESLPRVLGESLFQDLAESCGVLNGIVEPRRGDLICEPTVERTVEIRRFRTKRNVQPQGSFKSSFAFVVTCNVNRIAHGVTPIATLSPS